MTTQSLIPVFQGELHERSEPLCNARDLHASLQVGRDFSNWIKGRIEQYGFEEGEDYLELDSPNLANQVGHGGDRRSRDYHLTLDMAKELAMVENNDLGRRVRRYFIELERKQRLPATPFLIGERTQQGTLRITDVRQIAKLAEQTATKLARAATPIEHDQLLAMLTGYNTLLGLPAPDAAKLRRPTELDAIYRRTFWELVEDVGLDNLNHSPDDAELAINLAQLGKLAEQCGYPWPELDKAKTRDAIETALRDDARFHRIGRVNSRQYPRNAAPLRCVIFRAED